MSILSKFRSDASGNIMVMFGLSVLPVIVGMGLAVDYSRASSARVSMQAAVDSAAIAAARRSGDLSEEDLKLYAFNFFKENFNDPNVTIDNFEVGRVGKAIVASGKGTMPSTLMALAGYDTLPVVAETTVGWQSNRIEVALVLDNSGSMKGTPIQELRKAATNFVNTLENERKGGDSIKVSLVGFNDKVRVEADDYRNASWLRTEGITTADWQGCLTERDQPYNTRLTNAGSGYTTKHPAIRCSDSANIAPIVRLTDDMGTLRLGISKMVDAARTNLTLAATWGYYTLSDTGVFADGAPAGHTQKFMILFTDGNNTDSRHHGFDNYHNTAMDPDTRAVCTEAKGAGITLYTIRLGGTADTALLQDCASAPGMFIDVSNASQLDSAFQGIIDSMSRLRLTN